MVELLHRDRFVQCFMSAVDWDFSDGMFWFKIFFKDPYLCNPELDSIDTWTVVRYWSQVLNFYTVIIFFGVTSL